MSVAPLLRRTQPPQQSPERAALAEAITMRDAARSRLAGLRGAVDRALLAIRAARDERDQATKATDRARAADAAEATQALIADAAVPAPSLPAARRAQQDAEDALAAAETARDTINAEIAKLNADASLREVRVNDCAVAVLQAETGPAVAALAAELDGLHRRIVDLGRTVDSLIAAGAVVTRGDARNDFAVTIADRSELPPASWDIARDMAPCPTPTADMWEAAIAALKTDAAAPLPAA